MSSHLPRHSEHPAALRSVDPVEAFPALAHIPQPPRRLFLRGSLAALSGKKVVCIVGSRACTGYGIQVCRSLIDGLRGHPIVIVSGLAIGIDAIAHDAALAADLTTIALPGSGLDDRVLYPAHHRELAHRIIRSGGALVSEYAPHTRAAYWMFPQRNRLMAGIADCVIVIEAEHASGTLITARLATEYNKIVGAVPGPITAPTSQGTNWLLGLGAVPITAATDILRELGLPTDPIPGTDVIFNELEQRILAALSTPKQRDQLVEVLGVSPVDVSIACSTLEIKGAIRERLGVIERIG